MIDGEDDDDCTVGPTVSSSEVGAGAPPTSQPTVGGYGFPQSCASVRHPRGRWTRRTFTVVGGNEYARR